MKARPELRFLPLGGAGEIGMNLNLYGYGEPGDETWMMIDLGVTFGDGSIPGVDVIMPDPAFIVERRDALAGLVLTHAHEDHLGAVPYLWQRLKCPIYATRFTASFLRHKLRDEGVKEDVPITEVTLDQRFQVGPFELEMIRLTHSIPEPNAVVLRTPEGVVLHTGDWKLDPDPVIGPGADEEALERLGREGVLAVIGDSTNVFVSGDVGSEADLLESLTGIIGKCAKRVAVACFASNVARLETIAAAAAANDRSVVAAGRSIRRIERVARESGYLTDTPAFIDESEAGHIPEDKLLIVCTGSQGESRAALARIAAGDHPNVILGQGDTVIFSSRVIPGNENSVAQVQNQLVRRGIEMITLHDDFVHVSGHPGRDEMKRLYGHLRPRICVPVHGEIRHLVEHANLARECGVEETVIAENGTIVRLAPGPAEPVGEVAAGRLVLDGRRIVPLEGELIRGRKQALWNGSALVTVVLDGNGSQIQEPRVSTTGLLEADEEKILNPICTAIGDAVDDMSDQASLDDEAVRETARRAARRAFREAIGKRPVTRVHLVRI